VADTDFDFGFTAVDEEELKGLTPLQPQPTPQPVVSSDAISAIQARLADLDAKLVAFKPASPAQLTRVEEKIDRVLNMELGELNASVQAQGQNLNAVLDEVEERSNAMREECKSILLEVEAMILPLLSNLMKNPQKEYIHWPNRSEKLQTQIDKITKLTRSYGA
jgi:tetrahydromethanopterin S-methyltransferase subunit G